MMIFTTQTLSTLVEQLTYTLVRNIRKLMNESVDPEDLL